MGSGKSKTQDSPPEGGRIDVMRSQYGEESIECVSTWIKDYGFPDGGSFSVNQLEKLENRLTEVEKKMKDRKKIKGKDLEEIEKHKRCLKAWKEEAERRERKSHSKQMPKVTSKTKSDKPSSPYSPLFKLFKELSKVDPDLDTYPPPYTPEEDGKSKLKKKEMDPSNKATAPIAGSSSSSARGGSSTSSAGVDGAIGGGQHITTRSQTKMEREKDTQAEDSSLPEDTPGTVNLPEIQVAVVQRPWTGADIQNAFTDLPPPSAGGLKMAEQLYIFCKEWQPTENELKSLLLKHLGAANYAKIKDALGYDDRRPKEADWDMAVNVPYIRLLEELSKRLTTAFPVRINMTKVTTCKQGQSEPVEDYYSRLHGVFTLHSGFSEPTDMGLEPGMWETYLRNAFVAGLRPDIGEKVKQSCVDWENARLAEVMRHARHVEKHCITDKNKKDELVLAQHADLHTAQLALLQALEQMTLEQQQQSSQQPWRRGHGGRGGRGRGRGRGGPPFDRDQCYICRKFGHWAFQCP